MKVFVEKQKFDQWWFRASILVIVIILGILIGSTSLTLNIQRPDFWIMMGGGIFVIVLFVLITFVLQLETRIDEIGIHYGFWPFQLNKKSIFWSEISQCYVRKYSPISEYGGWGYRTGFSRTSGAMNVKGNIGIQIVLQGNRKLLIGTQRRDEVEKTLNTYSYKIISS